MKTEKPFIWQPVGAPPAKLLLVKAQLFMTMENSLTVQTDSWRVLGGSLGKPEELGVIFRHPIRPAWGWVYRKQGVVYGPDNLWRGGGKTLDDTVAALMFDIADSKLRKCPGRVENGQ